MNKSTFTIELPELSDEAAAYVSELLYSLIDSFDEYYYRKIKRHYRQMRNDPDSYDFNSNKDPL